MYWERFAQRELLRGRGRAGKSTWREQGLGYQEAWMLTLTCPVSSFSQASAAFSETRCHPPPNPVLRSLWQVMMRMPRPLWPVQYNISNCLWRKVEAHGREVGGGWRHEPEERPGPPIPRDSSRKRPGLGPETRPPAPSLSLTCWGTGHWTPLPL